MMIKEELEKAHEFFENIRKNRTEEEKRIIEQQLKEYEEADEYHRHGSIHPMDVESAKRILESKDSWEMRSNLSDKEINRLVQTANDILRIGVGGKYEYIR